MGKNVEVEQDEFIGRSHCSFLLLLMGDANTYRYSTHVAM